MRPCISHWGAVGKVLIKLLFIFLMPVALFVATEGLSMAQTGIAYLAIGISLFFISAYVDILHERSGRARRARRYQSRRHYARPHTAYRAHRASGSSAKQRVDPKAAARAQALRILELSEKATAAEVKARYRELAHMYHPDRAAQASDAIQDLAATRFRMIQSAYELLSK